MEEKNIIDEIMNIKKQREIAYVNFFSDGTITKDNYKFAKDLSSLKRDESVSFVQYLLTEAATLYSLETNFDELDMHMTFGLIYSKDQVNDDDSLKENAIPVDEIVRFKTTRIDSFTDGKKSNEEDSLNGHEYSGYAYYEDFINAMMNAGLVVDGPKTFYQLKYAILNKDPFDVSIIANLPKKEENKKLVRKM